MSRAISKIDDARVKLHEHGELFRKKGGRWTYDGCPVARVVDGSSATWRYTIPSWWVGTGTITALIKRREAVVTEKSYGRPAVVRPAQISMPEGA